MQHSLLGPVVLRTFAIESHNIAASREELFVALIKKRTRQHKHTHQKKPKLHN